MKRPYLGVNSKVLTRAIAEAIEKKDFSGSKVKSHDRLSLLVSILAIGISLMTLYFQFFYEKYHLIASIVDGTFDNDTTLVTKVIYHNKGNQHSTITQNVIYFYQDSTDIENKAFYFSSIKPEISYKDEYDPIVLTPGQQIYRDINQPINFKTINYKSLNIDPNKDIKMAIKIGFINDDGFLSAKIIPIGWLMLDTSFSVRYWNVDFVTKNLESDSHYSSRYVKPK